MAKPGKINVKRVAKLLAAGYPQKQIALALGVTQTAISYHAIRLGLRRRRFFTEAE